MDSVKGQHQKLNQISKYGLPNAPIAYPAHIPLPGPAPAPFTATPHEAYNLQIANLHPSHFSYHLPFLSSSPHVSHIPSFNSRHQAHFAPGHSPFSHHNMPGATPSHNGYEFEYDDPAYVSHIRKHHNPYTSRHQKKLNNYKPGKLIRNSLQGFNKLFGTIDPQQVKKHLGLVDDIDIIRAYENADYRHDYNYKSFSRLDDPEFDSRRDESKCNYDSDASFDEILQSLQTLKQKEKNWSRDRRKERSAKLVDKQRKKEINQVVNSLIDFKVKEHVEEDFGTGNKGVEEEAKQITDIAPKRKVGFKEKGDERLKEREEKKKLKEKERKKREKEKEKEREREKERIRTEKEEAKKAKKERKRDKKKTGRMKDAGSESDLLLTDGSEIKVKVDTDIIGSSADQEDEDTSNKVGGGRMISVARRAARLEELRQEAEKQDAEEEAANAEAAAIEEAEKEGGNGAATKAAEPESRDGEASAENEGPEPPEPPFGVQYDPDKQICLGDALKVGQRVWAVDFYNGKRFRKGKITKFHAPASYTIRFGLFHSQPGTQRLDIQVKRPTGRTGKKKRGLGGALLGLFGLSGKSNVYKACEKGQVQAVLDSILMDEDIVDKPGGKEKQTPLYYAAKFGQVEVVKLLLRYGAVDSDEGIVWQEATPEVRQVLAEFGWGKVGPTNR